MKKFLILGLIPLLLIVFLIPSVYGDLVHTLGGTKGDGNGQLDQPWGLAVNSTGYVFVTEVWNNRISVFDEDGNFKNHFADNGKRGSGSASTGCYRSHFEVRNGDPCTNDGHLNQPKDIELDSSGNIWVLDMGNQRIQKFDKAGNYLLKFGTACEMNPDRGSCGWYKWGIV